MKTKENASDVPNVCNIDMAFIIASIAGIVSVIFGIWLSMN